MFPTKPCPYCGNPMPDVPGRATCGKKACHDERTNRLRIEKDEPLQFGTVTCLICHKVVPRVHWKQITCGSPKCKDKFKLHKPEWVERARKRNREWAEKHRNVRAHKPILLGPPPYDKYLPGAGMELKLKPPPKWPLEHRNIRGLHGMITALLEVPHENIPVFSLIPWSGGCGWGVYVRTEAYLKIASQQLTTRLFDQVLEAKFSPPWRLKVPKVSKRGRHYIQISSITPVSTRNDGGRNTHIAPTSDNIKNTLVRHMSPRLNLDIPQENVLVRMLKRSTEYEQIPLGGKFGTLYGWSGTVDLEVNAIARWLLEIGAVIGLGGRTSLGFGCIRVSEMLL